MILTVTLNAAIDKRYVVNNFKTGEVNRRLRRPEHPAGHDEGHPAGLQQGYAGRQGSHL